ncbi:hypothetical protein C1J03_14240 [Sulfitobacter sp. SK012]|uniref:hypothetical protein n=1 Tax=Sulfitobacter sp. SK012 TaxID=1389005 RepID=UPI000E0B7A94|nr:hypothetical protein [Sulfitobacter sp. SK012]AXI47074.1 hypothetical protein C1J03_14240 [Sulfitobacter sp. SK012]
MSQAPVFLERKTYRRRRLMDAVRFLPFVGAALWLLPVLWPKTEGPIADAAEATPMSSALSYIFAVWLIMNVVALTLWWRTRDPSEQP